MKKALGAATGVAGQALGAAAAAAESPAAKAALAGAVTGAVTGGLSGGAVGAAAGAARGGAIGAAKAVAVGAVQGAVSAELAPKPTSAAAATSAAGATTPAPSRGGSGILAGAKAGFDGARREGSGLVASAKAGVRGAKDGAREKAIGAATGVVDKVVDAGGVHLKRSLHDPYMPRPLQRALVSTVDCIVLPDAREIARGVVTNALRREVADPRMSAPPRSCCPNPPAACRAWLLYHLHPHDKSFWGKTADPVWWLLIAISCVPVWGVAQAFWLLVLLVQDKRDEYQLVDFAVSLKVSQFFAGGLMALGLGAAKAAMCSSAHGDGAVAAGAHDCARSGPGSSAGLGVELIAAAAQFALPWLAMALLPYSQRKGGRLFEALASEQRNGAGPVVNELDAGGLSRRGGRLVRWLCFDLCVFALCAGFAWQAWFVDDHESEWVRRSRLYWLRAAYGLGALPFLLLKLPAMFLLVLHVKPTAYNRRGETVRLATGDERRKIYEAQQAVGGARWNCCGGARVAPG